MAHATFPVAFKKNVAIYPGMASCWFEILFKGIVAKTKG